MADKMIAKGRIFNAVVADNTTNFFATALTPSLGRSTMRVGVAFATAARLDARLTAGGATVALQLNGGTDLEANAPYWFDIPITDNETLNFQHSSAGAITVLYMVVDEVAGGVAGGNTRSAAEATVTSMIPGTGATSLGKAEDAIAASGDTGVMALAIRRDAAAADAADGDYEPLHTNSAGSLRVHVQTGTVNNIDNGIVPGVTATELGKAEDAVHATGHTGIEILAVRRDVAASGVSTDGDYATVNVDANGNLWSRIGPELPAGTQNIGDVDVVSIVPGTGATNLGKAEDAVAASGDTGVAVLSVRRDAAASSADLTGDYATVNTDANGNLWSRIGPELPAGTQNIGDVDVVSIVPGTGATNIGKAEDAVAASGDTGVAVLSVRRDVAASSADLTGDYATVNTDANGRVYAAANLEIGGVAAPGGAGAVSASTPRATLASDDPAVVALQIIDDWDETDRAKVNPIVGVAGVAAGSGIVGTTTQRVVLATDVGLPAGTSNIGDVDVVSQIPGTGATNLGKAVDAAAGATDTGVAALGLRDDALTALTPADGDYTHFRVDRTGAVWTHPDVRHRMGKSTTFNVQTAAYAAGDLLNSGTIVFSNVARTSGQGGRILSLKVKDLARQNIAFDLLLFDRTITVRSANVAFNPADADLDNLFAVISVAAGDYQSYADNGTAFKGNLDIAMPPPNAGVAIYGAAVTRGAPTYAAAGDLDLDLGISLD